MDGLQSWSEGDIIIDVDEGIVENTVFGWYDDIDEYNQERMEWDEDFEGYKLKDLTEINYNLGEFGVEYIDDILAELYNVDCVCRFGNEIFEMIE